MLARPSEAAAAAWRHTKCRDRTGNAVRFQMCICVQGFKTLNPRCTPIQELS